MVVNNRRSELEIISKILDLSKDGAKKTEILYYGNLSYMQLKSYLNFLIKNNILEEKEVRNNGNIHKLYKPTEKGLVFYKDIKKVLSHLTL
jgi:predicted transcriptional regulator